MTGIGDFLRRKLGQAAGKAADALAPPSAHYTVDTEQFFGKREESIPSVTGRNPVKTAYTGIVTEEDAKLVSFPDLTRRQDTWIPTKNPFEDHDFNRALHEPKLMIVDDIPTKNIDYNLIGTDLAAGEKYILQTIQNKDQRIRDIINSTPKRTPEQKRDEYIKAYSGTFQPLKNTVSAFEDLGLAFDSLSSAMREMAEATVRNAVRNFMDQIDKPAGAEPLPQAKPILWLGKAEGLRHHLETVNLPPHIAAKSRAVSHVNSIQGVNFAEFFIYPDPGENMSNPNYINIIERILNHVAARPPSLDVLYMAHSDGTVLKPAPHNFKAGNVLIYTPVPYFTAPQQLKVRKKDLWESWMPMSPKVMEFNLNPGKINFTFLFPLWRKQDDPLPEDEIDLDSEFDQ